MHLCHALGCSVPVPPKRFVCREHWRMVPFWLRRALLSAYRSGQETTKDPSRVYLVVATRCRLAIAAAENRQQLAPTLNFLRVLVAREFSITKTEGNDALLFRLVDGAINRRLGLPPRAEPARGD